MRIALLGDIHANLPALEAVLDDARGRGMETAWNIGDFVGYGAFPEEVVQRIRRDGILSIAGNYDRKVLRFPRKKAKWQASKRPEKYLAFQWAYENLSEASREYLQSLPDERRLEAGGRQVLLTHASPASDEEHLTPQTSLARLEELARLAQAELVICGHSHRAFARRAGETLFINTGSVGRPDDGDPRACYALLELDAQGLEVKHFRVAYDLERAVAEIRKRGLPPVFEQMIRQGVDLDSVQKK